MPIQISSRPPGHSATFTVNVKPTPCLRKPPGKTGKGAFPGELSFSLGWAAVVSEQRFMVAAESKYQILLGADSREALHALSDKRKPRQGRAIRVTSKRHPGPGGNLKMAHSSRITSKPHLSELELDQMSRGKNAQAHPFMFREELVLVFC